MGNYQESEKFVIKIGTDTLVSNGVFDAAYGSDIAHQIAAVNAQTILVSSGAMALGGKNDPVAGQALLTRGWEKAFAEVGLGTEEILVEEGKIVESVQQMRDALERGGTPLVNGNDAINKQRFGQTELSMANNDILSSTVAVLFQAHLLLLTNVDGVLDRQGLVMPRVLHLSEAVIFDGMSQNGKGGMKTKVQAAWEVAQTGKRSSIANGRQQNVITDFTRGLHVGTRFGGV